MSELRITGDVLYFPKRLSGSYLQPNARTDFVRPHSEETIYTNDRGWRCEGPGEKATPCKVAVTGCSWAMGTAASFKNSICGQLEALLQTKVANLAVGSFSIFQMVYRLRDELAFVKPDVVVISYGHWQTSRCFRSNAFVDVCQRPIMMVSSEDRKKVHFRMPKVAPAWLVDRYGRYRWLTDKAKTGIDRILMKAYFSAARLFLLNYSNVMKRLLGREHSLYVNSKDPEEYGRMREISIEWFVKQLHDISREFGCRVIIQHAFQYSHLEKDTWTYVEKDREIFERLLADPQSRVRYVAWDSMRDAVEQLMQEKGLSIENAVDTIYYKDNNHPDPEGYRLIAEAMARSVGEII